MFGTYKLIYEPGSDSPDESTVSMSFSGEATLSQMLTHYENFLIATGYQIDIDKTLEFVSSSEKDQTDPLKILDSLFSGKF